MLILLRRSRLIKCTAIAACTFLIVIYLMQAREPSGNKKYGSSDDLIGPRVLWSAKMAPVFQPGGKLGNFEPSARLNAEHHLGPGENGTAYFVEQNSKFDIIGTPKFGMNIAVSDAIALNRSIPDTRQVECRFWRYPELLPNASVVIVFHNEGLSVLLRTIHSVLNRTPKQYLHEILLVDDFSDMKHLRDDLERHIDELLAKGPVRLLRNEKREGLIRSKSFGAKEAGGEVVVFLDAHCEVNTNWLVPLLAPIARDPTVMTVPTIDGIDHETFQYRTVYEPGRLYRGIFEWGMLYKETELPESVQSNRKYNSEPYKSPTHAGGLFAINRKYFLQLNAYDSGLLVWGGENFELSFKIWQCGGSIEWVPCSRVGHVYRSYMPYDFGDLGKNKKGPLITINYKRVIETWFDPEYKNYFYTREPLARFLDMGDISAQLQLKSNLKCRNFEWFMENVAFDVYKKFPKLPVNLYWGELKTNSSRNICLDCLRGNSLPALVQMRQCHHQGSNQLFRLNAAGQLGVGERCIEVENRFDDVQNTYELRVIMAFCRLGSVDGPWHYDQSKYFLYNRLHKKCMTLNPKSLYVSISPCETNNVFQAWYFRQFNPYV